MYFKTILCTVLLFIKKKKKIEAGEKWLLNHAGFVGCSEILLVAECYQELSRHLGSVKEDYCCNCTAQAEHSSKETLASWDFIIIIIICNSRAWIQRLYEVINPEPGNSWAVSHVLAQFISFSIYFLCIALCAELCAKHWSRDVFMSDCILYRK